MRASALRPFLRRGLSSPARRSPLIQHFQHSDSYPPHKEYFQNRPGQSPLPDSPATFQSQHVPPTSFQPQQPSPLRRSLRSLFWATLFTLIGVVAGTGLVTWEYLNSPFDLDSLTEEEENEILQDILTEMRTHPVVESLVKDQWQVQEVYPKRSGPEMEQGMELLYETLVGTRGLTIHEFTHPNKKFNVLVLYLTDRLEGWPDTIHGGLITAVLTLAVKRFVKQYLDMAGNWDLDAEKLSVEVNFTAPVRTEDIYTIFVEVPNTHAKVTRVGETKTAMLEVEATMMQMMSAPRERKLDCGCLRVAPNFDESVVNARAKVQCPITSKKVSDGGGTGAAARMTQE